MNKFQQKFLYFLFFCVWLLCVLPGRWGLEADSVNNKPLTTKIFSQFFFIVARNEIQTENQSMYGFLCILVDSTSCFRASDFCRVGKAHTIAIGTSTTSCTITETIITWVAQSTPHHSHDIANLIIIVLSTVYVQFFFCFVRLFVCVVTSDKNNNTNISHNGMTFGMCFSRLFVPHNSCSLKIPPLTRIFDPYFVLCLSFANYFIIFLFLFFVFVELIFMLFL